MKMILDKKELKEKVEYFNIDVFLEAINSPLICDLYNLLKELKEKAEKYIRLSDYYKDSYFWKPFYNGAEREKIEKRDSVFFKNEKLKNLIDIEFEFRLGITSRHFYVHKNVWINDKRSNIRKLENILREAEYLFDILENFIRLNDIKIDENKLNKYLELYKKNFPDFINVIDLAVKNRIKGKSDIIYINAPKNWGKDFLIKLFEKADIAVSLFIGQFNTRSIYKINSNYFAFFDVIDKINEKYEIIKNDFIKIDDKKVIKFDLKILFPKKMYKNINLINKRINQIGLDLIIFDYKNNILLDDLIKEYNIDIEEFYFYLYYFLIKYIRDNELLKKALKKPSFQIQCI